jgi:gamma-glutamyltranspeptidase
MLPLEKSHSSEGTMKARRLIGLFIAIIFVLTTVVAFAAGDSYVVIKNKNGDCSVIKAQEKTPKTIAGPFKTKEEAQKAKEKECSKKSSEPTKPPKR